MSNAPALFTKHRDLAYLIAQDYYLPDGDHNDVRQEALVALWEAARAYDRTLGPFPAFARIVINRRLRDAIRNSNRAKHRVLTDADREHEPAFTHDDEIAGREDVRALVAGFRQLSLIEREAVTRCANGDAYAHDKQIDNALFRARRKLRQEA